MKLLFNFLRKIKPRKDLPAISSPPRTYNFVGARYWGHDYSFTPTPGTHGTKGRITGWHTPLPRAGDFLQLQGPSGGPSSYRVIIVEDCDGDPSDMFFADVEYDPDNPAIDWSEFNEAIDRGRVDKKWKIQ